MVKSAKNFYELLGVTPDVESIELKKVYRKLVRKYHPDINPEGASFFKEITAAYETLSDDKLRLRYDTLNGIFRQTGTQDPIEENNRKSYQKSDEFKRTTSPNVKAAEKKTEKKQEEKPADIQPKKQSNPSASKKEFWSDSLFLEMVNEIIDGFSKFSKKNNKSKKLPKPVRGEDIYAEVTLSVNEALCGTSKVINVVHTKVCTHCGGRRFMNDSNCPECGGKGKVTLHQKINVKIPAHIKDGAKLRLSGEGKSGQNGGKNGDLYLKIKVVREETSHIENRELFCEVPISPFEAVLGGDIKINQAGCEFILNLPKNTLSGQVFRISSKGLMKNNLFDDIIVTVKIQIPETISEDEIQLYEKLRTLSENDLRKNFKND